MATTNVKKSAVKITDDMICNVASACFGGLIYVDPRTREKIEWEDYGVTQQIPFEMLRTMKMNYVKFFKNNWVVIKGVEDEPDITPADVYRALHVEQFYRNIIDPDNFESVCAWKESEIEERVKLLTPGARQNLTVALNTFIENGTLDSVRKIKAFEKALGCELSLPE